jgi:hypothetical protein
MASVNELEAQYKILKGGFSRLVMAIPTRDVRRRHVADLHTNLWLASAKGGMESA